MFDDRYETRLANWREFRDSLESSNTPFEDLVNLYNKAPLVSRHTDPWDKKSWPNPWELISENEYCDFSCVLGMCYSLQLTERFKDANFEIHISIDRTKSSTYYLLYVNDVVIGYEDSIINKNDLSADVISQRMYEMSPVQ